MRRVDLLAGHMGDEVRYNFGNLYPHVMFCIKLLSVFRFVAAYIENAVSYRYIDVYGRDFFTATLEMCRNSSPIINQRDVCVCASKPVSIKCELIPHIADNPCSVRGNINWFRNH
jgi:hypothetical protein